MKKIFLIIVLLQCAQLSWAQFGQDVTWFDISARYGYGFAVFHNKTLSNDDAVDNMGLRPASFKGIRLGVIFPKYLAITVDGQIHDYQQDYTLRPITYEKFTKRMYFQNYDVTACLKYLTIGGLYLEAGGRISLVKKAWEDNSGPVKDTSDITGRLNSKFGSLVFGLGAAIYRSEKDRLRVNIGLRSSVSLQDIAKNSSYPPIVDGYFTSNNYKNASKTNLIATQLLLEIDYYFAFIGQNGAKDRRVFY